MMQAFLLPNLSLPDKPAPISHPLTQQSYSLATAIIASSYFRLLCLDFTEAISPAMQTRARWDRQFANVKLAWR